MKTNWNLVASEVTLPQTFHSKTLTLINIFRDVLLSFIEQKKTTKKKNRNKYFLKAAKKCFSDFIPLHRSSEGSGTSCVSKVIYMEMLNMHMMARQEPQSRLPS